MIAHAQLTGLQKELNLAYYGESPMPSPNKEPTKEEQIDNIYYIFQREGKASTKEDIENKINEYEQATSDGFCGAPLCVMLSYMK